MKLSKGWMLFVAAAIAVLALVLYLAERYPDVLASRDGQVDLTTSLLWLGLIGSSLFVHRRMPVGHALRYGAIWVAMGAGLVLVYSFRHEAEALWHRLTAELLPHQGRVVGDALEITAGAHGHFVLEAEIDGTPVRFLVDTGASDVVLSPRDAERLGFKRETLSFTKLYRTANGMVRGAPVRLGRVRVGPILIEDVRASVNGAEMDRSLLGMSFLSRLGGYEVRGDRLILRP
jgi:aspartyl protease family protein